MKKKTGNPDLRGGLIQARVNMKELGVVHTKAVLYTAGDLSKFVRMACLNYRNPVKKTLGEK